MSKLFVIIATAILLHDGGKAANNDLNNDIETVETQSKPTGLKKFIQISKKPPAKTAHGIGETVHLTCEAMGSPAPTIRWLKNDEPIIDYNPETNQLIDNADSSIAKVHSTLIVSLPSKNLEDIYSCIIKAGHVTERADSTVYTADSNTDLIDRYRLMPSKPIIVYTYHAFMDTIGNDVVIPCKARGHPRPNVYWKDNRGHIISRTNRKMQVLKTGELVIRNIRWADMGDYVCIARNSFGRVTSTTFIYPVKAG